MTEHNENQKEPNQKKSTIETQKKRVESLIEIIRDGIAEKEFDREALEKIKNGYKTLSREEKYDFFSALLDRVELSPEEIEPALESLRTSRGDSAAWRRALSELRDGIESPRLWFFRKFINVPGGLKFLLDLRADLLALRRNGQKDLGPLDNDLVGLFESWFEDGFLFLEEITLNSPYRQIEIIKRGDMVHPMTNLEEMSRRLGVDRRCFALYHRSMPGEPIVFIEVALTKGIVRNIHDIIRPADQPDEEPGRRDTAIFYSINNTQNGLAGLGMGKVLIFQVVDFLKKDAPDIRNFCTLSPMPGFWSRYLQPLLERRAEKFTMDLDAVEKLFDKRARSLIAEQYGEQNEGSTADFPEMMLDVFSKPQWVQNKDLVSSVAKALKRLGYAYLTETGGQPDRLLDPVAGFHLGNGAILAAENVNFGATMSPVGVERSLTMMVNYVYSQDWRLQLQNSMAKLTQLLPGLSRLNR